MNCNDVVMILLRTVHMKKKKTITKQILRMKLFKHNTFTKHLQSNINI